MGANRVPCEEISQSTFYTMIPSLVRSRIPVLASLRQSAKAVTLQRATSRRKAYTLSSLETTQEQETHGFAATVPPSGVNTPLTRPSTPEARLTTQERRLPMLPQSGIRSDIDWDVAATGIRLWVTAKTQAEQGGDPVALRNMHIDALRYMHMALPPNLTPLEIESLRASMSPALIFQPSDIRDLQGQPPPSVLRQGVARAVCWLVASVLLVLPVIMACLGRILQFERQHQVTERVLTNGLDLTSSLGERGMELQKAFTRFKEGRLGGACAGAGSWFVEGIVGGVNDGLDAVAQSRRKGL